MEMRWYSDVAYSTFTIQWKTSLHQQALSYMRNLLYEVVLSSSPPPLSLSLSLFLSSTSINKKASCKPAKQCQNTQPNDTMHNATLHNVTCQYTTQYIGLTRHKCHSANNTKPNVMLRVAFFITLLSVIRKNVMPGTCWTVRHYKTFLEFFSFWHNNSAYLYEPFSLKTFPILSNLSG